jgi:hypothetical protein
MGLVVKRSPKGSNSLFSGPGPEVRALSASKPGAKVLLVGSTGPIPPEAELTMGSQIQPWTQAPFRSVGTPFRIAVLRDRLRRTGQPIAAVLSSQCWSQSDESLRSELPLVSLALIQLSSAS